MILCVCVCESVSSCGQVHVFACGMCFEGAVTVQVCVSVCSRVCRCWESASNFGCCSWVALLFRRACLFVLRSYLSLAWDSASRSVSSGDLSITTGVITGAATQGNILAASDSLNIVTLWKPSGVPLLNKRPKKNYNYMQPKTCAQIFLFTLAKSRWINNPSLRSIIWWTGQTEYGVSIQWNITWHIDSRYNTYESCKHAKWKKLVIRGRVLPESTNESAEIQTHLVVA